MRMQRRIIGVFCLIVLLMTGVVYRIYYINLSDYIAMAADIQGQYALHISSTRGMIYDRNMNEMVNREYRYVAAVMPTPQAAAALADTAGGEEERAALMDRMVEGKPFAMELAGNQVQAPGVDVFRVPERYGEVQYAPHLLGYLSGDGKTGVAGIERAYDEWLTRTGEEIAMRYQVDAAGRVLTGAAASVDREGEPAAGGVVLTLDADMQLLAQNALQSACDRGAAVVMDVHSGEILAMASLPVFDQNDIAGSLEREDAPFVNRAVSGYSIGSIFKLLISAAALENGIPTSFSYYCEGAVEVDGRLFRCNDSAVHGEVDMRRALQVSCNGYFIELAKEMDPAYVTALARNMGLATAVELAEGVSTQAGNLPDPGELNNALAYANFSFGQGSSLASPLQMAQVVSALANGGKAVSPRLVRGLTEDGFSLQNSAPSYAASQVIGEGTARIMRGLMVSVVEEGSGRTAKPLIGSAGGKTSSAQTGQLVDGEEIVHAWFAGFYPAQEPRYSIVVFVEGGESGEYAAAPVFQQIADGISGLEKNTAVLRQ